MSDDVLPSFEIYRGVPIYDFQPKDRIDSVVKPAIDAVFATANADNLVSILMDRAQPPEARLLAGARLEALWALAAQNREVRPKISMVVVHAHTAGLDSLRWADPDRYGSLIEPGEGPGQRFPRRDPHCASQLLAAQAAHLDTLRAQ